MNKCKNKVNQWVESGWSFVERKIPCGSIGVGGGVLFCGDCEEKLKLKYPQGWRHVPGDICKHGNYVGNLYGPDFICGKCEDE